MGKKREFNKYEVRGDITALFLRKRDGTIFETLIDTEDLDKLKALNMHWHLMWLPNANAYYCGASEYLGYVEGVPKYRTHYLHNKIMNNDGSYYIDHINHNALDNRKENLRSTANNKNTKHRKSRNSNNKTGYRNVSYIKSEDKYIVQLQIDGKNTRLGAFDDVDEAGIFAQEMRKKYYKEFAGNN